MFHFALFKVKTTRLLKTNNKILKVSVFFKTERKNRSENLVKNSILKMTFFLKKGMIDLSQN